MKTTALASDVMRANRRRRIWVNRLACALLAATVVLALGVLLAVLG